MLSFSWLQPRLVAYMLTMFYLTNKLEPLKLWFLPSVDLFTRSNAPMTWRSDDDKLIIMIKETIILFIYSVPEYFTAVVLNERVIGVQSGPKVNSVLLNEQTWAAEVIVLPSLDFVDNLTWSKSACRVMTIIKPTIIILILILILIILIIILILTNRTVRAYDSNPVWHMARYKCCLLTYLLNNNFIVSSTVESWRMVKIWQSSSFCTSVIWNCDWARNHAALSGGAEIVGVKNAGVENEGVECALLGKLSDKCTWVGITE